MRVLITGASGFLGQWVVRECHKRDYDISILCRKSSSLEKLEGIPIKKIIGDLSDKKTLIAACKEQDLVIHLAGKIAYKRKEYQSMWQTNVEGTQNLLDAMQEATVKEMIYMSSVVAIGANNRPLPLNEDSPYNIAHLKLGYFDSKHEAEKRVLKYCEAGKLNAVIVNPSTIYGPGDASKSSRKIQIKVAKGKFPFYTSGGVNVVHVQDVVDLMFRAYDQKLFNQRIIAGGENLRIKELFTMIAKASGVSPPKIYLPNLLVFAIAYVSEFLEKFGARGPISVENAITSTRFHWFSNENAKQKLGMNFQPAEKAIEESVKWAKNHGYI